MRWTSRCPRPGRPRAPGRGIAHLWNVNGTHRPVITLSSRKLHPPVQAACRPPLGRVVEAAEVTDDQLTRRAAIRPFGPVACVDGPDLRDSLSPFATVKGASRVVRPTPDRRGVGTTGAPRR